MQARDRSLAERPKGHPHVWVPLLGAAVFLGNVVAGKYAVVTGTPLPTLGDSAQFLLLGLTVAAFTRTILVAEANAAVGREEYDPPG